MPINTTFCFPQIHLLAGPSSFRNTLLKAVCKTVVLLEKALSSKNTRGPWSDNLFCWSRFPIRRRRTTFSWLNSDWNYWQMLPGGIELVKLHNEKVTSPLVTVGSKWDVNHVKTCLVKVTCMSGRQEKLEGTRPRQAQWQSQWIQSSLRAANNHHWRGRGQPLEAQQFEW